MANGEKMCSGFCSALRMFSTSPGKSCNDIYQINKATRGVSGLYWVKTGSRTVQHVYCDMELECGGHKEGWLRVAQLNTTNGDSLLVLVNGSIMQLSLYWNRWSGLLLC